MSNAGASDRPNTIDAKFSGVLGDFVLDSEFQTPMGGITALFGPSGCGKTTILRCIAGLTRLAGKLTVGGETWQDDANKVFRSTHERSIGYVFQEASLFPHLSVAKNLLFGNRRATRQNAEPGFQMSDVVDLLGIGQLLNRSPDTLSGGERQRVAVGRALLSQPRLLLMDEPLSALDRQTKEEILPYFEAVHHNLGLPIVYVSHDIGEVSRLADHMVLIARGKRVAVGPMNDMLERLDLNPATGRFEAGVVLTTRVVQHDPQLWLSHLKVGQHRISIPYIDNPIGDIVRLRIRARDVALATRKPQGISIRNVLAGKVVEIAQEPDTAFAETLVDIGNGRLRARITRASVLDLKLEVGMAVYALVKSISFDSRSITGARKRL